MTPDALVTLEGETFPLSNLDKPMYPAAGWTKAHVIDYYRRVAPALLPHLERRPLTMKRYPDGVDGEMFYAKACPAYAPDFVRTVDVWSEGNDEWKRYCTCDNLATLVWLANLADLEMHTNLHRADAQDRPDFVAFDLDPGPPADVVDCAGVALRLREALRAVGLASWPKTSGSKGLQVYVPLNTPVAYEATKPFAHAMALLLEQEAPDLVVSNMRKTLRKGKVFVDWSQNDDHKTTVCVYSLRAKERPTVSTPVTWHEVEEAYEARDKARLVFEADEVLRRVEERGDLFEPVLRRKQGLPDL